MQYKVIPFAANITRDDTSATVANQMQTIIDNAANGGWKYMGTDSVQTSVAPSGGCFGIGQQPGFTTSYNVLVFQKEA